MIKAHEERTTCEEGGREKEKEKKKRVRQDKKEGKRENRIVKSITIGKVNWKDNIMTSKIENEYFKINAKK